MLLLFCFYLQMNLLGALLSSLQVVRRMQEKLGLQDSNNTFALYKQNSVWEQPVAGSALIADVLTRLVK